MKFLVDAQLPRRMASLLRVAGHDAVHTLELPNQNLTPDTEIVDVAAREGRVVITKDADFLVTFTLKRQPKKLLLVSTGNITNADLEAVLLPNMAAIVTAFDENDLVEMTRTALIIHS